MDGHPKRLDPADITVHRRGRGEPLRARRPSQPGVRFAARPSGTEPKIKFYLFARTEVTSPAQLAEAKSQTATRLDQMASDIEEYIKGVL